jgi:FG-GAP repeat protein
MARLARSTCAALCAALALAMTSALAPPTRAQQPTLTPNDQAAAGDFFDVPMAISGDTLVIGATGADAAAANKGSVRVFVRKGGVWTEQQMLVPNDGAAGDGFGGAVAIQGNTIVVGASGVDVREVVGGRPVTRADAGAVYVFVQRGGAWLQEQKLLASDRSTNALFGTSVALQGDTVAVGAMGDENGRGSAYVFTRSGQVWTEQQKLVANDRIPPCPPPPAQQCDFPFFVFGRSMALAGDTLVVGSPRNGLELPTPPGAAYVFVRSNGMWTQRQKLVASDDGDTNGFGNAFSLSGDTLTVAAPGDHQERGAVYVFVRNTFGAWNEQQKVTASDGLTGDLFGLALALNGRALLVGAAGNDVQPNNNQGSAYVFELSDGVWIQRQKLIASDGVAGDGIGFSVAIRANQLFVGTHLDTVAGNAFQGSVRVLSDSPAQ